MSLIDYEKLPVIDTFKKLKRGDSVYSKKFGLGTVFNFYNKEVIVAFNSHRQRFTEEEKELIELPESWLKKKNPKVKIEVNGQEMTLQEFKRIGRELKRKQKLEKELAKLLAS